MWASDGTADGTECDALTGTPTPEVCGDGIDNDCNGDTDDGAAIDAQTWCPDVDTDTYGDPDTATSACTQPGGLMAECTDCDDTDPLLWAIPGETGTARFLSDKTTFTWEAPVNIGGTQVVYDVIRSVSAENFMGGGGVFVLCVSDGNHYDTMVTTAAVPAPGDTLYYVARAWNRCGDGSIGTDSSGVERAARECF